MILLAILFKEDGRILEPREQIGKMGAAFQVRPVTEANCIYNQSVHTYC